MTHPFKVGDLIIGSGPDAGYEFILIEPHKLKVTKCPKDSMGHDGYIMEFNDRQMDGWMARGSFIAGEEYQRRQTIAQLADHADYYAALTETDHEPV